MSIPFVKLFQSITESSIWFEDNETRILWITMLVLADSQGRVLASVPGLAHRARLPEESVRRDLDRLIAPDKNSRSKEHEGRRIEIIDGGWRLMNYMKYRQLRDPDARREQIRIAVAKHRQKKKQQAQESEPVAPEPVEQQPNPPEITKSLPVTASKQETMQVISFSKGRSQVVPFKAVTEQPVSQGKPRKAQVEVEVYSTLSKGTEDKRGSGGEKESSDASVPTVQEVIDFGKSRLGDEIPADECRKYHTYQDVNRKWFNGQGFLKDWKKELAGWWVKDRHQQGGQPARPQSQGSLLFQKKTQLEAVKEELSMIRKRGTDDAVGWKAATPQDSARFKQLILARNRLIAELGGVPQQPIT